MEFIEVIEPVAMFQGRREGHIGKEKQCRDSRRQKGVTREVRKENHPSSRILERDGGRGSQGADTIHGRLSFSNLSKNSRKQELRRLHKERLAIS